MPFLKRGGATSPAPGGVGDGGVAGRPVRATRAEPVVFYAHWTDRPNQQADDFADAAAEIMLIAQADVLINMGGFRVENTGTTSEVVFAEPGVYTVSAHAFFNGANGRSNPKARIKRTRGGDVAYGIAATGGYLRGTGTFSDDASAVHFLQPLQVEAGDKITIQVINTGNQSLDLDGDQSWLYIVKEEGKLTVEGIGGNLVDVTLEHHPPTATLGDRNAYIDRSFTPPKVWLPHVRPAPDMPPDATSEIIAAGAAGYRGVHYQAPTASAAGDWFWSTEGHSWKYRAEGRFHNISFAELKAVAMNAAGNAPFFAENDVFLNRVLSHRQAAQIIENDGDYDPVRNYYFILGSTFRRVDVFTAAVNNRVLPDYIELFEATRPGAPVNDNTIVAVAAHHLVATDVDKPDTDWALFNPGGQHGAWVRVYVPDIPDDGEAETDVSADATKALSFPLDAEAVWYLSANSAGKITTAASDADKFPANLQMRPA